MKKLPRDFYDRTSIEVAKDLLGKYIVHIFEGEELIGKIVEVEAYKGPMDKAAHSYNNRRTERTEVMFGPPGFAYVFVIYGKNYCMNVVTEEEGKPEAVLIRALEPIKGLEKMAQLRYNKEFRELNKSAVRGLTNGPGKLCQAMAINRSNNGEDLLSDKLFIAGKEEEEAFEIVTTKRINIDYAEEARDFLWRYYIKENDYVSVKGQIL